MDQVYGLFDRRCRTETALDKLARLRRRVRCFKSIGKTLQKLFSPNLEKALTFLDDKLLPSTSNAVERGYRRHRKMQKTVYRVRTKAPTESCMAKSTCGRPYTDGTTSFIATDYRPPRKLPPFKERIRAKCLTVAPWSWYKLCYRQSSCRPHDTNCSGEKPQKTPVLSIFHHPHRQTLCRSIRRSEPRYRAHNTKQMVAQHTELRYLVGSNFQPGPAACPFF